MTPSRTAVGLFLFGFVFWLTTFVGSFLVFADDEAQAELLRTRGFWLVLLFDAVLLFLLLVDAYLAWRRSSPNHLTIRREYASALSLGVENEITLVVENASTRSLLLEVRDRPPTSLEWVDDSLEVRIDGHGWQRVHYTVTPTERGSFRFGDIAFRCRGPMGLAWMVRSVACPDTVSVYPNLLEVRRYESLVRSSLVRAGGYRVLRMPGAGREFSHYREYTPDDDYRQVSWKATARRNKPISSVFESERSQDIIFCLDVGRMMAARVGTLTKLDHAINAVLMLAHVSQTFQDNLGLLVFSHTVHQYLPPAKGQGQHARFLQALYRVQPELCYVNYHEAFSHLIARHPKRALTFVFTDLLDRVVSREFLDAAKLLRRFHMPLTLAVADVPLQELADEKIERERLYDILVARQLLLERSGLLQSLEREGVMVIDTIPERLTLDAVNRYLALKM